MTQGDWAIGTVARIALCGPVFWMTSVVPVFAHESHAHHVMGIVMALNANSLRVKTKEGMTVGILITPNTSYRSKGTAMSSADLKVGDRVVVELILDGIVTSEGGEVGTAQDIRFAPDERKYRTSSLGVVHPSPGPVTGVSEVASLRFPGPSGVVR
jgi:hypothetical protein